MFKVQYWRYYNGYKGALASAVNATCCETGQPKTSLYVEGPSYEQVNGTMAGQDRARRGQITALFLLFSSFFF